MKTYAYVTSETCSYTRAELPGETVSDRPVSRHGDYVPWRYGKRETVRILAIGSGWIHRAARAVAMLYGWQ